MSWQALAKRHSGTGGHVLAGVRLGVGFMSGQRPSLRIVLGGDVLKRLRWAGRDRITIAVGTGEHAGRLRLERPDGKAKGAWRLRLYPKTGTGLLRPARPDGWPERLRPQRCDFAIDGGALIVTLPPALKPAPVAQAVSGPVTFDDAALKRKARGGR